MSSSCRRRRFRPPGGDAQRRGARLLPGAVVLIGLALSGCAAPVGVLEPTAVPAPDATHLDILVATTRAATAEKGVLFSGERGETTLASFVVSIPSDERRQIGQVQWPRALPPDPNTEFATLDVNRLSGWPQFENWLRGHAAKHHRALLFVHGFNTRFESALFGFAQIYYDSGAQAAPILFSWPSRGGLFNYVYDRESAAFSRDALEKLLARLVASPDVQEITVLAHSMGAWLAMESLRQMAIREGRLPAKIQNVILASPDLDIDVFRAQLKSFGAKRPSLVVFLSRQDRALALSRGVAGNIERLGAFEPSRQPWIDEKGVDVIDLSDAAAGDPLRHSKFARNPDVVRFLGEELINGSSGEPPSGLGERVGDVSMGVAQGVATAAGLAINAPIAIVDPDLRRAYTGRLQQFRQ